jgi:hypothetical protein
VSGHAFISYSRRDLDYVERLAAHLSDSGVPFWYEDPLAGDDRFEGVIQDRIDGCFALIVVRTPASAESAAVRREWGYAQQIHKLVLPLLVQPCPAEILLAGLSEEDVIGGHLPSEEFVERLSLAAELAVLARRGAHASSTEDDQQETTGFGLAGTDPGWAVASRAAEPVTGTITDGGLPQRLPMVNLVPGELAAGATRPERRNAAKLRSSLSDFTAGHQRARGEQNFTAGD